jgi:membrane protein implicated in regulation of membrane protease activity
VDSLVGESAIVLEDIPPGGVGKAELRGTSWNARNVAKLPLAKAQRCIVKSVEGLTLWIQPE